jgi:small GTP-binding protein
MADRIDLLTPSSDRDLKIVLVGLDNAGKSSVLIVLKKMYQFEDDLKDLMPTVRIDYYKRDFLGYHINFWDFGGQSKYRERYIQRKVYFEYVNQLVYLIDISDPDRIPESMEYFAQILEVLEEVEYDKNKEIYVCFSKMDYDAAFSERPEYIVNLAKARSDILKRFPQFKFDFFSTSIYNVYSIVKMVSKGLTNNIPKYKQIFEILEDFSMKNNLEQVVLFDNTGLIIADCIHHTESYDQNTLDKTISGHLKFYRTLEDQKILNFKEAVRKNNEFINASYQFHLEEQADNPDDRTYYLSVIAKNRETIDWKIEEIIEKARHALKSIIDIEK